MKLAVIVSVHNEEDMIIQFLNHYRTQEVDHFFIFDNWSTDKTTEILDERPDVSWLTYGRPEQLDDMMKLEIVSKCRQDIASEYEYAIIVDADEFIYNSETTIKDFILEHPQDVYTCAGFHMIQHATDAPYIPDRSLTLQRKHGVRDTDYDKHTISRTAANITWGSGYHDTYLNGKYVTPEGYNFLLLHYNAFDYDIAMRHRMRQTERTREVNQSRGHGSWKHGISTRMDAENWFMGLCGNPQSKRVI